MFTSVGGKACKQSLTSCEPMAPYLEYTLYSWELAVFISCWRDASRHTKLLRGAHVYRQLVNVFGKYRWCLTYRYWYRVVIVIVLMWKWLFCVYFYSLPIFVRYKTDRLTQIDGRTDAHGSLKNNTNTLKDDLHYKENENKRHSIWYLNTATKIACFSQI